MECKKCKKECLDSELKNGICKECRGKSKINPKIETEIEEKHKTWCVIGLIAVVFLVGLCVSANSNNTTISTASNVSNNTTNISNSMNESNNTVAKVEKNKVAIIDFSQMSKEKIRNWCRTNKVLCNITDEYHDTIPKDSFVSQSMQENDTVYEWDKINVVFSLGKEPTLGQKNALMKAKSYLKYSAFSYEGLIEQLEYEEFSHDESVYGADNCGANWEEQAVKKAKSYMEYSSFSRNGLIEQLEYEGFTKEQAEYGVSKVGY